MLRAVRCRRRAPAGMSPSCFHDCHLALFTTDQPQGLGSLHGPCTHVRRARHGAEAALRRGVSAALAAASSVRARLAAGGAAAWLPACEGNHSGACAQLAGGGGSPPLLAGGASTAAACSPPSDCPHLHKLSSRRRHISTAQQHCPLAALAAGGRRRQRRQRQPGELAPWLPLARPGRKPQL